MSDLHILARGAHGGGATTVAAPTASRTCASDGSHALGW